MELVCTCSRGAGIVHARPLCRFLCYILQAFFEGEKMADVAPQRLHSGRASVGRVQTFRWAFSTCCTF